MLGGELLEGGAMLEGGTVVFEGGTPVLEGGAPVLEGGGLPGLPPGVCGTPGAAGAPGAIGAPAPAAVDPAPPVPPPRACADATRIVSADIPVSATTDVTRIKICFERMADPSKCDVLTTDYRVAPARPVGSQRDRTSADALVLHTRRLQRTQEPPCRTS
jgi:hypothetical protein